MKRIKELAEQQAGSILMDLVMPDAGMPERIKWNIGCTAEHLEKFAELIVLECAQVSEDDITDGDACCTNTAYRIAGQIKKHFGVEE